MSNEFFRIEKDADGYNARFHNDGTRCDNIACDEPHVQRLNDGTPVRVVGWTTATQ